jgi:lipopolysaccharide/colanic/teichoic acid biosynthesis glycosyltransferase
VATSERILTTPPSTGHVQPLQVTRTLAPPAQPVWLRALLDFGTVLVALIIGEPFTHTFVSDGQLHVIPSAVSVALTIVTILAFAGAYPRIRTPLDIASTEGMVKAASFAAILLAIDSINWHTSVSETTVSIAMYVTVLLVIQREVSNVILGRTRSRRWFTGSQASDLLALAHPVSHQDGSVDTRSGIALKRAIDVLGSALLLILILPLGLAVAVLIKLDSRGPVFLRQKRVGRCGTSFYMWKFRSMYVGVARYARSPISDSDPRLTRIGRAIRRLSIDELPQLLNVLTGDMSLVGPRPEMPFIVKTYTAYERLRLNAAPGITGLWQISPARAMPIHQNLELDLFYIEHRNFFLDTAIMLRTVTAVVRGIGAL